MIAVRPTSICWTCLTVVDRDTPKPLNRHSKDDADADDADEETEDKMRRLLMMTTKASNSER